MTSMRDSFLSECARERINVTVFTTNGFQLKGVVIGFDGEVVVLSQNDGK